MKPNQVGTHIRLQEELIAASRAMNAFKAGLSPELAPGVEDLDYWERFDKIYETLMTYAEPGPTHQTRFGKKASRSYHVPTRMVTSESGEEYGLVFNIHVSRDGFRSPEKKVIRAGWFDLEKKHSDSTFGPSETVENGTINIGTLADVEWAVAAYLEGVEQPRDDFDYRTSTHTAMM